MDEVLDQIGLPLEAVPWRPAPWENGVDEPCDPLIGRCRAWPDLGVEMYKCAAFGYPLFRQVRFYPMDNNGSGVWTGPLPLGLTADMTMADVEAKLGAPYDRFDNDKTPWPYPNLTYEIKLGLHANIAFREGRMIVFSAYQPTARGMLKSVKDAESFAVFSEMRFYDVLSLQQTDDPVDLSGLLFNIRKWAQSGAEPSTENKWRMMAELLLTGPRHG